MFSCYNYYSNHQKLILNTPVKKLRVALDTLRDKNEVGEVLVGV